MTPSKLEDFKNQFKTEQIAVKSEIENLRTQEIDGSGDEIDAATAKTDMARQKQLLDRAMYRLKQVDLALKRITDGTFGICADCEEDIDERRLAAKPTAHLCLDCQEASEFHSRTHVHGREFEADEGDGG